FALQREGYAVDWQRLARDGEAALAGAQLVILDVGLPDDSGFEVLKRIRRAGDIPVLMLTARADEIDRIVGLELGADDYVVKPFSPREVVARVRAILKRLQPRSAERTEEISGFEHDVAGRRIRYRGHWLTLTPSEYRVLALLISAPGRVFSRAQLLDALGEAAEDSFERTIDSHVKSVRAKLRDVDANTDPIETHRGFGYALRAGG
ncbi:MAG TPA: two-component system response regulator CreB, partial [Chitinolyticbacter sp.]|nr:two-component system response regulator CreB [Chitinolyticbacter sp.]